MATKLAITRGIELPGVYCNNTEKAPIEIHEHGRIQIVYQHRWYRKPPFLEHRYRVVGFFVDDLLSGLLMFNEAQWIEMKELGFELCEALVDEMPQDDLSPSDLLRRFSLAAVSEARRMFDVDLVI